MSVLAVPSRRLSARRRRPVSVELAGTLWIATTVALLAAAVGAVAFVGGDARWLAALGRVAVANGIPHGIPFATAPTSHWPNTLVLAELCLYGLERLAGDAGLVAAQTLALALALAMLARDARARGAAPGAVCAALALLCVGAIPSLAIVRVQLFSLALFPALLALLRAEARRPSRRIWLALGLLALWSNLHGAALVGLVLLYPYLLLGRGRAARDWPTAVGVGALAPIALCATPAGLRTVDYYHGLLTNLAAARGVGMWVPLGLGPFDLALVAVALALAALTLWRGRPMPWELAVVAILAAATVKASRDGIWLLFTLMAPAALAIGRGRGRSWIGLLPLAAAAALTLGVRDVVAWAQAAGRPAPAAVTRAIALADGGPILADTLPGEEVALAGGRIWAGNPVDAFSRPVQATFLDFTQGSPGGAAALRLPQIRVVLVTAGSSAAALVAADPAYRLVQTDAGLSVYLRGGPARR